MNSPKTLEEIKDAMARRETFEATLTGPIMTDCFKHAFMSNYRFHPIDPSGAYGGEQVDIKFIPN